MERFRSCFADLADPRTGNAQRHDLLEVLLIALAATLCGAETCVDMADFGEAKEPFLRRFLRLEGGVPSHDSNPPVDTVLRRRAAATGLARGCETSPWVAGCRGSRSFGGSHAGGGRTR